MQTSQVTSRVESALVRLEADVAHVARMAGQRVHTAMQDSSLGADQAQRRHGVVISRSLDGLEIDWVPHDDHGFTEGCITNRRMQQAGRLFVRTVLELHAPRRRWHVEPERDVYTWSTVRVRWAPDAGEVVAR